MIAPGTQLGPYEISTPLGVGGMGEVYRARDTRLKREVALKILPQVFATDSDRLARFQREAEVLASLNHPNIAAIHGLEESNGIRALVMELVEGPTLADRIAQGPIPIDEALPIAKQIAEALEAAHEQGIIHRDLKPANIKLRPDGTVKVLDFGLAKALEPTMPRSIDATASPTITSPAVTGVGVLLGTAAYMSPEQARGKAIDKRSDIWAFGCVLYETITARQAFRGESVGDTLAAVLRGDPDWGALPVRTPDAIRRLLRGCLEKDRQQRFGDTSVVKFLLKEPASASHSQRSAGVRLWPPAAVVASLIVAAALVVAAYVYANRAVVVPNVTRTAIPMSGSTELTLSGNDRDIAITPDGSRVVYRGNGGTQIFLRALSALEPVPLGSVGQPRGLFASPDGQWIGYFDGVTILKKVPITGGPSITLGRVESSGPRGATWGPDGTIVFATLSTATGLFRISAGGGEPTLLTQPDHGRGEGDHVWPEFLPGGQQVLFTILSGALENAQVAVLDLRTGTKKVLLRGGSHAHYLSTGHLVYAAGGVLRAVAFDPNRLEVIGAPVQVIDGMMSVASGAGNFDVSGNGTLVFVSGDQTSAARRLVWIDRRGQETSLTVPPRLYQYPRISPDGTRIALDIRDQENDIWILDAARTTLTRFTFDPTLDRFPVWAPNGRRLLFSSDRAGAANVFAQAADGTGVIERLTNSPNDQFPTGVSPDGRRVLLREIRPLNLGSADLMVLNLSGPERAGPQLEAPTGSGERSTHDAEPLIRSSGALINNGTVSPDGRWLAYQSDESGRDEIYVRPFPDVDTGRWLVSSDGGRQPVWARSGRDLFYLTIGGGALTRVPVESGASWSSGSPSVLFKGPFYDGGGSAGAASYDISPDGQRFLMVKIGAGSGSERAAEPPNLIVVQQWLEELKRLVPSN
jgi:serine/threonine-protein kinase